MMNRQQRRAALAKKTIAERATRVLGHLHDRGPTSLAVFPAHMAADPGFDAGLRNCALAWAHGVIDDVVRQECLLCKTTIFSQQVPPSFFVVLRSDEDTRSGKTEPLGMMTAVCSSCVDDREDQELLADVDAAMRAAIPDLFGERTSIKEINLGAPSKQ